MPSVRYTLSPPLPVPALPAPRRRDPRWLSRRAGLRAPHWLRAVGLILVASAVAAAPDEGALWASTSLVSCQGIWDCVAVSTNGGAGFAGEIRWVRDWHRETIDIAGEIDGDEIHGRWELLKRIPWEAATLAVPLAPGLRLTVTPRPVPVAEGDQLIVWDGNLPRFSGPCAWKACVRLEVIIDP